MEMFYLAVFCPSLETKAKSEWRHLSHLVLFFIHLHHHFILEPHLKMHFLTSCGRQSCFSICHWRIQTIFSSVFRHLRHSSPSESRESLDMEATASILEEIHQWKWPDSWCLLSHFCSCNFSPEDEMESLVSPLQTDFSIHLPQVIITLIWRVPSVVLITSFCSSHGSPTYGKLHWDLSPAEDANDPKGSVVISPEDDEDVRVEQHRVIYVNLSVRVWEYLLKEYVCVSVCVCLCLICVIPMYCDCV